MHSPISFKQIFNETSNGVVTTDTSGTILQINRQAENILGLDAKKHQGAHITELLPMIGPHVLDCLRTGTPLFGHHIAAEKNSIILNITIVRNRQGNQGAICNFQEMQRFERSARKLESYRILNQQLSAIFQSVSDALWVCSGQGVVININKASEKLNAIKADEVIGKHIEELVEEGMYDQSVTSQVLKKKKQVTIVQHIYKTGKDVLVTGTPVFNEKGDISLVVINSRDLTKLNAVKEQLENSLLEREKLQDALKEISFLELKEQEIVAESKNMRQVLKAALKLAHLEASNILLLGESGTGKGLLAKFLHNNGRRNQQPFIQINCAALPENLLEAELFGYEKGAFTGARERGKAGLLELAQNGTLFLDEIGDLSLSLQAKLLKYLDDQEVMRIGGLKSTTIDCTVIAATNQDLKELARLSRFRQDLYYRLSTFSLRIPPLRERPEDIFGLARHFLNKSNQSYGMKKKIRAEGFKALMAHPFPGNVRELKNIIKNAVVMSDDPVLDGIIRTEIAPSEPPASPCFSRPPGTRRLLQGRDAIERELLQDAMRKCKSTREMAAHLGVSQSTVVRKMKKHGIANRS